MQLRVNHMNKKGFTLVEMLVAVAIFTLVMLIATASIFTIVAANKKAQSLKSVMDNLSFALDSMTRNVRTGYAYNCATVSSGSPVKVIGDCPAGDPGFEFTTTQVTCSPVPSCYPQVYYYLWNGQIWQNETDWTGGALPITAAEINISSLNFILIGSVSGDRMQPRVILDVIGGAGTTTTASQFKIQTTLSQRQIDS